MPNEDLDLVSKLSPEERLLAREHLKCSSPDDAKYWKDTATLSETFLSAHAEWLACAHVQKVLLQTRVEFGKAEQRHLADVEDAMPKIDTLNIALLEDKLLHDQKAVLAEFSRHVSPETLALMHPGTTSYDILDTARSWLLKRCWKEGFRPKVAEVISKLCNLAELYAGISKPDETGPVLQTGRTHLQNTSPVVFGAVLAGYAARLAARVERADAAFGDLRGKISGIVGTGASIEQVFGTGKSREFEAAVLEKLDLKPDYTASQIVQKERLADVGNAIVTSQQVLSDFANDIRILYSAAINEIVSRDSTKRLGGSSADPAKDNPINWENIAGKAIVVSSGMPVLYAMIMSDLQRDLRNSVQGRYQPAGMIVQTYESFVRASKALDKLSVNKDKMAANLEVVRRVPSEAMQAIARARGWYHPTLGDGYDAVNSYAVKAKQNGKPLLEVALEDPEFVKFHSGLGEIHRWILSGQLEHYTGSSVQDAKDNVAYARKVAQS
jgi:adenylosuccinate lyase